MKVKFYLRQGKWAYINCPTRPDIFIPEIFEQYTYKDELLIRRVRNIEEMGRLLLECESEHKYKADEWIEIQQRTYKINRVYKNPEGYTIILYDYCEIIDDEESKEQAYQSALMDRNKENEHNHPNKEAVETVPLEKHHKKKWWRF